MRVVSVAKSDVGRKRPGNEDACHRDDETRFYVVADGVGGLNKGEVASAETVEHLRMWIAGARSELTAAEHARHSGDADAQWRIRRLLESGVQAACYMVYGMSELDPGKRGMSTTCSALLIQNGFAYAAHVGDSRVYRLRAGQLLQLTEDHTLINYKLKHGMISAAEASQMKGKNVITRAVGHKDYVQVDTADIDAIAGDRFVLCTDGLHGYVDVEKEWIELFAEGGLTACADAAIALANHRGGKDNITVIVCEVAP